MPFNDDGSRKNSALYKKSGFKMKGNPMQRNFGSPVKLTDAEKRANLLKVVPNKEAFNKLTPKQQKAFTKVGKAVGFPIKKN